MRIGMTLLVCLALLANVVVAQEVPKGKIPPAHLDTKVKELPWQVAAWDVDDALPAFKSKAQKVLWVDTRPSSFFKQGTIRDAALLVYNQSGSDYPDGEPVCTKESLEAAMAAAGADVVVFFCQGPKCHRSYNAAYVAVKDWGMNPSKVVWFRGGYPNLFKSVGESPKLKRKAKRYLSDDGVAKL